MKDRDRLEHLFVLADRHGCDTGEFDHAVGDLQDFLRFALTLMTAEQKREFFESEEVKSLEKINEE